MGFWCISGVIRCTSDVFCFAQIPKRPYFRDDHKFFQNHHESFYHDQKSFQNNHEWALILHDFIHFYNFSTFYSIWHLTFLVGGIHYLALALLFGSSASLLHLSPACAKIYPSACAKCAKPVCPVSTGVQRANQAASKPAPHFQHFNESQAREIHFFSGRSLARHHVNDYVSLSDGPLTSSRSYSRLHAAVERQKCDKRPGFGGKKLSWTNVITRFFSFVCMTVRSFVLDHLVHHQHHWLALAKSLNRIFWNTTHD